MCEGVAFIAVNRVEREAGLGSCQGGLVAKKTGRADEKVCHHPKRFCKGGRVKPVES